MRTVAAAIKTAERSGVLAPRHTLKAYNDLISFAAVTTQTNANLETGIAQSYAARTATGTTRVHAAYRTTAGNSYVQYIAPATLGDWALTGGALVSNTYSALRNACFTDPANDTWLYTATHGTSDGTAIQIKRQNLNTATSNPITVSLSNYGPTFGPARADTATLIRRIEAVCPTDYGVVIVAVGTHDYTNGFSTIRFWQVDGTTASELDAILNLSLPYAKDAWYNSARYCSNISAVYHAGTATIWVVANDHALHRAVTFGVKAGVCTAVRAIVPVDPDAAGTGFMPYSLTHIGALYYLTGRYSQTFDDGSAVGFDLYLTSNDAEHWSFGERNSFLCSASLCGTLLPVDAAVYGYAGNLSLYTAAASFADGGTTRETDVSADLVTWGLSQTSSAADGLSAELTNAAGTYDAHANVRRGARVVLTSGQEGSLAAVGVYGLDELTGGITTEGRETAQLTARDWGHRRLIDMNTPVDVDWWGQDVIESDLQTLTGLVIKTPTDSVLELDPEKPTNAEPLDYDVTVDSNGLRHKGLNSPLVAYADTADAKDGVLKATVQFADTHDGYHLSSFGFVFGAADNGHFNAALTALDSAWNAKATPRLVRAHLAPYDEVHDTGGLKLERQASNLWDAPASLDGTYNPITLELASHYVTEAAFEGSAGATYDLALRAWGKRVQLWQKPHDYEAATCATSASYTLISEYTFTDDTTRYQPGVKNAIGLCIATDVWGDKQAYKQAYIGDMELQLTSADNGADASQFTVQAAIGTVEKDPGGATGKYKLFHVGSWTSSDYSAQMWTGRYVRFAGSAAAGVMRVVAYSAGTLTLDVNVFVNTPQSDSATIYYPAVQAGWGSASSGYDVKTVSGSSVTVNPGAHKNTDVIRGRALFVSDDNTATSFRLVETDGIKHLLYSGSHYNGGTELAWDATNPLAEPNPWRMVLHHGYLFEGSAAAQGLPNTGHITVDSEVARYGLIEGSWRGVTPNKTSWTCIPAYYTPLADGSADTATLAQWTDGVHIPGDNFGDITDPAGLLVEVTSRGGGSNLPPEGTSYHAVSVSKVGGVGRITITPNYPNAQRGSVATTEGSTGGDLVITSGRGQLGTKKAYHEANAPVAYYPAPVGATARFPALVTVSRFDAYLGAFRCVEDALRDLAALAGMREATFRNTLTGANATTPYALAITTSNTALPTAADVADFTLDAQVHIPSTGWLVISFRNYYEVRLQEPSAGRYTVGLATYTLAIDPASDGIRWFEKVPSVYLSPLDTCPAATDNASVRLAVQGGRINLSINGAQVFTFNAETYVASDGATYDVRTAGPINVRYTSAVASNATTWRVLELGAEVRHLTLERGSSAASAISDVCDKLRIRTRATAAGGVEFARHVVRDDGGTLTENLYHDAWTLADSDTAGYFLTSGKNAAGAVVDATWIAAEGFRFAAQISDLELSDGAAGMTARAGLRELQEFSEQRGIEGAGFIELQPEDQIALAYSVDGTNEFPAHASTSHVITGIELSADDQSLTGTYSVRKYIA